MDLSSMNWLAVIAAALSSFMIGGLWYGPLFGRLWMRASGMTAERAAQARLGLILSASFGLQLVTAVVLALFINGETTYLFALFAAASVGLFWVAPALGVVYLFEQRSMKHWAINAGYHVVAFTVMGLILGAWR